MRSLLLVIVAFALLSETPAFAQYSGSGYSSSSDSSNYSGSSTRVSGRAIGKLIGLVVAGFLGLCGFIWRAVTGSGGNSESTPTVQRQPQYPTASGSPPPGQGPPHNLG